MTAPIGEWIFRVRRAGWSFTAIARRLNERGVPCPSRADRARNTHRPGEGRQVWNRQGTDHDSGSGSGRSWNDHSEWIVSDAPVHPPLVSEADFVAVQSMRAADGRPLDQPPGGLPMPTWPHKRTARRPDLPPNLYTRADQLLELLAERLDLEDHDEIGPYLNNRGLVIVYDPDGVEIRPVNDVRPDQMAEPVSMG